MLRSLGTVTDQRWWHGRLRLSLYGVLCVCMFAAVLYTTRTPRPDRGASPATPCELDSVTQSTLAREPGVEIDRKVCALLQYHGAPAVLIGGDSRAERQMDPAVFGRRLGLSTLNIAIRAGDPLMLHWAIHKYPKLVASVRLVVLSVGVFHVNDGVAKRAAMSLASFVALSHEQRLALFRERPGDCWAFVRGCREWCGKVMPACTAGSGIPRLLIDNRGFVPCTGVWDRDTSGDAISRATWYRDLKMDGVRASQFLAGLDSLASHVPLLLVVRSPMAPSWREATEHGCIGEAERAFAAILEQASSAIDGLYFLDAYHADMQGLNDSSFSDYGHLNENGASVYSNYLCDAILVSPGLEHWRRGAFGRRRRGCSPTNVR